MNSSNSNSLFAVGSLFGRTGLAFACILLFTACASTSSPSPGELARIDNPPENVRQKLDELTPLALEWVAEVEEKYLQTGRKLSEKELAIAREIGVLHPDRIRVIILKDFPHPKNLTLRNQTKNYGLDSASEGGRTMGNIIMLKARHKDDRWRLAYELVHVAQQEKMGRQAYVRRYMTEYELVGKRRSPLELHAQKVAFEYVQ